MQNGEKCKCPHHKMMPVLVFLFGLDFLLGALGVLSAMAVGIIWPCLIIIASLKMLMKGRCKCCNKDEKGSM